MYDIPSGDLPRLLVFSRLVPETRSAGSLLLFRLLKGYPAGKLLVIGPRPHAGSEILPCRYATLGDVPFARLYRTRFGRLKRSVTAFGFGGEVSAREAEQLTKGFHPQVVLTVMEESQYFCAAGHFSTRHNVPLVMLIHDLVELFEPVYSWAVRRQRMRNSEVCRLAAARMCISPAMAVRVRDVYGVDGDVLFPNRSEELTPRPIAASEKLRTEGRLTIGYAGGLSYGYAEAIQGILPALKEAGATLRIYSARAPEGFGDSVQYGGFASSPLQTWERVKKECDVVLLPYHWEPGFRDLYQAHFPSKLPEYLALGVPVLITGPAYAAGVAWGLQHPRAALTVSDPSQEAMRDAFIRLRDEPSLRVALATEAVDVGSKEFDPEAIRGQFIQKLREVVSQADSSCD